MKETDLLIIGGGPGGYVAAIRAAQLGKKVLLADKGTLGGECLHWGCIPSKAFISAADSFHKLQKGSALGLAAEKAGVDLARLQSWKTGLVAGLSKGIQGLLKGNHIELVVGEARLTGPGRAALKTASGEEEVAFGACILATGSRPIQVPGFEFGGDILDSKAALDLQEVPRRLLVVGGGVIGLELGTFFAKVGAKVTVVELLDQLLPGFEADLAAPVARSLAKLGVQVHLRSKALGWEKTKEGLRVRVQTPEGELALEADKILVSVGRAPNTAGLGLDAAGVRLSEKGFIRTDEGLRTGVEGIYAIGDAAGPPFLAHKASREGIVAAETLAGGEARKVGPIPFAVFTDPEVATVGLTEAQAKAGGREVVTGKFPFAASGRALSQQAGDGFVRVVAEKESGVILGVQMAGPHVSDLIAEACLALQLGATVHDVAATVHAHPTLAEAFLEACEAAAGHAIHVLVRR